MKFEIDAAGEFNGYASDISRTFPANGKFTDQQKVIYQAVLNAQKALIAMVTYDKFPCHLL